MSFRGGFYLNIYFVPKIIVAMPIIITEQGFYTTGSAYDTLGKTYPYNVSPQPESLEANPEEFYIRRPLDYKLQFLIFKDDKVRIVKGEKILTEFDLLPVFDGVEEYSEMEITIPTVNVVDSTDTSADIKANVAGMNVADYTKTNNFINIENISIREYTSIMIIPQYHLLSNEEIQNWAFLINLNGVWSLGDKFFLFSSNDSINSIIIANPMSEDLKFKILLFR